MSITMLVRFMLYAVTVVVGIMFTSALFSTRHWLGRLFGLVVASMTINSSLLLSTRLLEILFPDVFTTSGPICEMILLSNAVISCVVIIYTRNRFNYNGNAKSIS